MNAKTNARVPPSFETIGQDYKHSNRRIRYMDDREAGMYAVAVALGIDGRSLKYNDKIPRSFESIDALAAAIKESGLVPERYAMDIAEYAVNAKLPFTVWEKHMHARKPASYTLRHHSAAVKVMRHPANSDLPQSMGLPQDDHEYVA